MTMPSILPTNDPAFFLVTLGANDPDKPVLDQVIGDATDGTEPPALHIIEIVSLGSDRRSLGEVQLAGRRGQLPPDAVAAAARVWVRYNPDPAVTGGITAITSGGVTITISAKEVAALRRAKPAPLRGRSLPPPGPSPNALTIFSDPYSLAVARGIWAADNGERERWQQDGSPAPSYRDPSNGVLVYFADAHGAAPLLPMEVESAWEQVLKLNDRTVSAFLICMGKWLAETGAAGPQLTGTRIHVADILAFRDAKKHVHGGYPTQSKRETREDLLALNNIWVRGTQEITEVYGRRQRRKTVTVDSRLLEVAIESDRDLFGEETPYAFRIRPGEWAAPYLGEHNRMTATLLQPIMRYDPRQGVGRMAMRLGIYLTFHWRIRAAHGNYGQPWLVRTLLEGAGMAIPTDRRLYTRFRDQFEEALETLSRDLELGPCSCTRCASEQDTAPGWHYEHGDEDDLPAFGWFQRWLKWTAIIPPPLAIRQQYERIPEARTRKLAAAKAAGVKRGAEEGPHHQV